MNMKDKLPESYPLQEIEILDSLTVAVAMTGAG